METLENIIKDLADSKRAQAKAWREVTSSSAVDYDNIIDEVDKFKFGNIDTAIKGDSEMPSYISKDVQELLINGIQNTTDYFSSTTLQPYYKAQFKSNSTITYAVPNVCSSTVSGLFSNTNILACGDLTFASSTNIACDSMFYNCNSLRVAPVFIGNETNLSTSLTNAFNNCYNVEEVDLSHLHGGVVMNGTFNSCFAMKHLYLNDDIYPGSSNAITGAFENCRSLDIDSITAIKRFIAKDPDKIVDMDSTFQMVLYFNTDGMPAMHNVKSLSGTFINAGNNMPDDTVFDFRFLDGSPITNMARTFSSIANVRPAKVILPDINYDNVSNINGMLAYNQYLTLDMTPMDGHSLRQAKINNYNGNWISTVPHIILPTSTLSLYFPNLQVGPYVLSINAPEVECIHTSLPKIDTNDTTLRNDQGYEFKGCKAKEIIFDVFRPRVITQTFYNCSNLERIQGLDLSNLVLSASELLTGFNALSNTTVYAFALCSKLADCILEGTLYKSNIDMSYCPLNLDTQISWINALYDWKTNPESKTTDDTSHKITFKKTVYNNMNTYIPEGSTKTLIEIAVDKGWTVTGAQ